MWESAQINYMLLTRSCCQYTGFISSWVLAVSHIMWYILLARQEGMFLG